MVYGGDGLARSDGRVVLTPYVLPGELIEAELRHAKSDLMRGTVAEVLEASGSRVDPECPYFGRCGGCHYQHTTHEYQVEQKALILREALRRVGRLEFDGEIATVGGEPWHYRNRTQLHFDQGKVGYFAAGSHAVVCIDHCPISSPRLNDAIGQLARNLPHYRGFEATVELFTNETDVQVHFLDRVPHSVLPLFEELGTGEPLEYGGFQVSRGSFFQINRYLVDQLVEAALAEASGGSALDLYAGVGLFTQRLASRFGSVTAVESGSSAFRDLEWNMQRAGWAVNAVKKTAEEYLPSVEIAPDLIVADPPRSGLGKVVISELLRLRAAGVTIVSCDPATLARDLGALVGGGYRIERMTLVDLFPQTYHLETVVHLGL